MRNFSERILGKGIVIAKDVPGFVANRLGVYGMVSTMRRMMEHDLTIDEVDGSPAPLIGRAKTATFRTGDLSGLDVLVHVTAGLSQATGEDLALPDWVHELVKRAGSATRPGAGFYKKTKEGDPHARLEDPRSTCRSSAFSGGEVGRAHPPAARGARSPAHASCAARTARSCATTCSSSALRAHARTDARARHRRDRPRAWSGATAGSSGPSA